MTRIPCAPACTGARRVAATETEAATEIEAHPDRVGLVRTRAVCRVPCALLERMLSITAAPHRHRRRRCCCCYGRRTVQLLRVAQGSNGTDQDPHRADVEADVDEQLPFLDDSQPLEPPRGACTVFREGPGLTRISVHPSTTTLVLPP